MTYTGIVFSLESGFKKILLTPEVILVLNRVCKNSAYTRFTSAFYKVGMLNYSRLSKNY